MLIRWRPILHAAGWREVNISPRQNRGKEIPWSKWSSLDDTHDITAPSSYILCCPPLLTTTGSHTDIMRSMLHPAWTHARRWAGLSEPEARKLAPLATMFVLILLVNTLLRDMKDALAASALGAEALPTLKGWVIPPISLASVAAYNWIASRLSTASSFAVVVGSFTAYYALFAFVLFPFSSPAATQFHVGTFFVLGELWGTVVLTLLFWSAANEAVSMQEAVRLFPLFGMVGQIGPMLAGQVLLCIAQYRQADKSSGSSWTVVISLIGAIVVACSILIILCHRWWLPASLEATAKKDPSPADTNTAAAPTASPTAQPHNRCIWLIAMLVAAYGISLNMVEVLWREALSETYKDDAAGYSAFMGYFWTWTGAVTFLCMALSSVLLRWVGFGPTALACPVVVLVSGGAFFGLLWLQPGNLPLLTMAGAVQSMLAKASKYSMFDTTKEIAFVPLDSATKRRAKALIDVVGYRWSKALGAVLIQASAAWAGSLKAAAPHMALCFVATMGVWLYAAQQLSLHVGRAAGAKVHID